MVFGEKWRCRDSKTGRLICIEIMQKADFAHFLSAIEAKF
jgi:hypothetical protein